MNIINKFINSRFHTIVVAILMYDVPLVCLLLPFGVIRFFLMLLLQVVMVYVCMRLFDNCNDAGRSSSLHIQVLISIIGCFFAYGIGIHSDIMDITSIWMIPFSMLLYTKNLRGICGILMYLLIDSVLCGSGIMFSIGMELAKENDYIK